MRRASDAAAGEAPPSDGSTIASMSRQASWCCEDANAASAQPADAAESDAAGPFDESTSPDAPPEVEPESAAPQRAAAAQGGQTAADSSRSICREAFAPSHFVVNSISCDEQEASADRLRQCPTKGVFAERLKHCAASGGGLHARHGTDCQLGAQDGGATRRSRAGLRAAESEQWPRELPSRTAELDPDAQQQPLHAVSTVVDVANVAAASGLRFSSPSGMGRSAMRCVTSVQWCPLLELARVPGHQIHFDVVSCDRLQGAGHTTTSHHEAKSAMGRAHAVILTVNVEVLVTIVARSLLEHVHHCREKCPHAPVTLSNDRVVKKWFADGVRSALYESKLPAPNATADRVRSSGKFQISSSDFVLSGDSMEECGTVCGAELLQGVLHRRHAALVKRHRRYSARVILVLTCWDLLSKFAELDPTATQAGAPFDEPAATRMMAHYLRTHVTDLHDYFCQPHTPSCTADAKPASPAAPDCGRSTCCCCPGSSRCRLSCHGSPGRDDCHEKALGDPSLPLPVPCFDAVCPVSARNATNIAGLAEYLEEFARTVTGPFSLTVDPAPPPAEPQPRGLRGLIVRGLSALRRGKV